MHWIDIVIVIWLVISALSGFKLGFVYKLGSFVGFIASLYLASRWTPFVVEYFHLSIWWTIAAFMILLSLLSKAFGILAWAVDKVFSIIYIIPLTKLANKLLGAALSLIVTAGIIASGFVVAQLFSANPQVAAVLDKSFFAGYFLALAPAALPFISIGLKEAVTKFFPSI